MDIELHAVSVAPEASAASSDSNSLCLECGLCCNGVIFADVKLQPEDDAARLGALGLPLSAPKGRRQAPRWKQPCPALEGCRCRIYGDRPGHCRAFECALLKRVKAGRMNHETASHTIQTARDRAEKVRRGLRDLGDNDEATALAARFRRVARRVEQTGLDEAAADTFGRLTLAVQDLNVLLSEAFYPGRVAKDPLNGA